MANYNDQLEQTLPPPYAMSEIPPQYTASDRPPQYTVSEVSSDFYNAPVWQSGSYMVDFLMFDHKTARRQADIPWAAQLTIRTKNLPRLMRQGFHWSVENIQTQRGYISSKLTPDQAWTQLPQHRVWYLTSNENERDSNGMPLWVGKLQVHANDMTRLAAFEPARDLKGKFVTYVLAYKDSRLFYQYYFDSEFGSTFNAICNDLPLNKVWWSWPVSVREPTGKTARRRVRKSSGCEEEKRHKASRFSFRELLREASRVWDTEGFRVNGFLPSM